MDQTIRWGIISTADINSIMIPAIKKNPRCELNAISSREKKKAEEQAKKYGIPHHYGNYDDLINDKEIDAVYISLPNGMHHEWCIKSAKAGKHILCEKPLATNVSDCNEIIYEAEKNKVYLQEGFMYRYHPQTLKIYDIVQSGILGDLQYLYGVFTFSLKDAYGEEASKRNYRLNPILGGGCLWDIGSYIVNLCRYLTGNEPLEVFGSSFNYPGSNVDGSFFGLLKFPKQVVAQIQCSFLQSQKSVMEVVGSKASLRIPYPYCLVWDRDEPATIIREGHLEEIKVGKFNSYEEEINHFCGCVLDNLPRAYPLEDSLNNIKVLCSLLKSAKDGKLVSV